LTVAVVTLPFGFEGSRRRRLADEGVVELRRVVDALIVIPNDRLLDISSRHTTIPEAFQRADDMLRQGVQGIADLVTVTGLINLDFADVRSVMENAGSALMAIGEGSGEGRALKAAQAVVTSPLLEHSIAGAAGILLNVTGGPDLSLHEMTEVAEYVTENVAPDANIIVGATVHPRPEAEIRVTLIATGMPYPGTRPESRTTPPVRQVARPVEPRPVAPPAGDVSGRPPSEPRQPRPTAPREPLPLPDDADPLDVPPFLRRLR
jgi:cell division protein FtsZ